MSLWGGEGDINLMCVIKRQMCTANVYADIQFVFILNVIKKERILPRGAQGAGLMKVYTLAGVDGCYVLVFML